MVRHSHVHRYANCICLSLSEKEKLTILVILRYISRWLQLGSVSKFKLEDYLMIAVAVSSPGVLSDFTDSSKIFFTLLIVFLNMVYVVPTNLIPPDQLASLTESSIETRIYGSKLVIGTESLLSLVGYSLSDTLFSGRAVLVCYNLGLQGLSTPHVF